ncbi:MAG: NAD(P) transhydrogenase subunit beta [Sodalis sp.]|nr:MAG: NAD(P) transhydrogenase subunit beta [Sodalis sp.]
MLGMDEINDAFSATDAVLVIGANDINQAAQNDSRSPIAGIPMLEVWKAYKVVVFKAFDEYRLRRSENPLFLKCNAQTLFGDAKQSVEAFCARYNR